MRERENYKAAPTRVGVSARLTYAIVRFLTVAARKDYQFARVGSLNRSAFYASVLIDLHPRAISHTPINTHRPPTAALAVTGSPSVDVATAKLMKGSK